MALWGCSWLRDQVNRDQQVSDLASHRPIEIDLRDGKPEVLAFGG
jgi:hypothetical protein